MTMNHRHDMSRRALLGGSMGLLGTAALGTLLGDALSGSRARAEPHFTPRARRVVYMFMAGGPGQLETFDHKPGLVDLMGTELPASVRMGQRVTTMTSGQSSFPVMPSRFGFARHGESGAWVSDLLPHTAGIVDKICIVRSMQTDAINHDPAITLMQTGSQLTGRPSMGAWLSYGLGSTAADLPLFSVLVSDSQTYRTPQPLNATFWGSGFLPAQHQGVMLRGSATPVLYVEDPTGLGAASRERIVDTRNALDALRSGGDPAVDARIAGYELAFRMQSAVPELADLGAEPDSTYALYGEEARTHGTFAANCVMARRLLERGSSFVQLYHRDWDHHLSMATDHPIAARDTDRAAAALVLDLEARGLLEDTLVIWGGEFGRTVYSQVGAAGDDYGRDHHPRCFSMWMAGGGVRPGLVHGETDDFSYNVVSGGVHVHDLHATALHLLGFDHTRLTYRSAGRDFRLTDVAGRVVSELLIDGGV
jgi:hypothetical protein